MRRRRQKWEPTDEILLRAQFVINPKPELVTLSSIAVILDCSARRVQIWFQNKRQRRWTATEDDVRNARVLMQEDSDDDDDRTSEQ